MTTTNKAVATKAVAKTTRTRTTRKKAVAVEDVTFTNVKDIASHYFLTSKNVRRLLRSNKTLLQLDEHQKNAIYKFNDKQSNAIKEFFDSKYKTETNDK